MTEKNERDTIVDDEVQRAGRMAVGAARRVRLGREAAADLVHDVQQAVLVAAWRYEPRLEVPLVPFLRQCARHALLNGLRAERDHAIAGPLADIVG